VFSVINRSPRDGEPGRWDSAPPDPLHRVYGLVAWVPNLSGDGSVLILEGTSMSGTEGAWDFVSDDSRLLPFLKRIERPDGTIPHFEVLLGTQNMNASAVRSTVLAWRTSN
jgi:surface antigen